MHIMKKTRPVRSRLLNRQKCILYMVEWARRPVSRLALTKWAFLLAREMPSGGGSSFYDFLPYQYGPFSFTLFREADKLVRDGYLREAKIGQRDAWETVPDVAADTGSLPRPVRSDAERVVERFADTADSDLIDHVYEHFPWYTANSQIRRLAQRGVAAVAVYTVGYEGCSIDRLLDVLMRTGIHRIIDVRRNAVSRRYGFHGSSLARICGKVDIDYAHVPEVGIPTALRRDLRGPADYAKLIEEYARGLLPEKTGAVAEVCRLLSERPSALMCMEADPALCHRSRLADTIATMTHLPVRHIRGT